jgi:hypothetical protein
MRAAIATAATRYPAPSGLSDNRYPLRRPLRCGAALRGASLTCLLDERRGREVSGAVVEEGETGSHNAASKDHSGGEMANYRERTNGSSRTG